MATSFQAYVERENITNPDFKNSVSKASQGQRGLSAKRFHESKNTQPTPRKALGDVGNFQHNTAKKFETPKAKPSRVKIFQDTPRTNQRKSTKSKKATFSTFNANKVDSTTGETKIKTASENSFPEIEKMTPFIDTEENDFTTPQYIKRLLQHPRIINPSSLIPPKKFEIDDKTFSSHYEFDTVRQPYFDDTMANIISSISELELCEIETDLPSLDDIPLLM